jgi:hypothetical protein
MNNDALDGDLVWMLISIRGRIWSVEFVGVLDSLECWIRWSVGFVGVLDSLECWIHWSTRTAGNIWIYIYDLGVKGFIHLRSKWERRYDIDTALV